MRAVCGRSGCKEDYYADRATRDYPLGVHCGSMLGKIRDMFTFEGLAYACYDYPEMVEDMVETACVLVEDYLDQVLGKIDFDYASGWEDICFKNGPIVSVEFFKRVVMPRYKRIHKKLREAGIDIWYTDCDGDVRPILPYFLEGNTFCDHRCPPNVKPEDYLYYLDLKEELFGMK
ncbi:MAG: hypothetical protein ACM3ZC_06335 [Bacteroidota bacterium]